MAIVKMNKLSLIGLEADKERIIESLMKIGVVEIIDSTQKASLEEWKDLVISDGNSEEVAKLDESINKVKSCIDYLSKYDKRKKSLFPSKRNISISEYGMIIQNTHKL